jgi:YD repeat-containing protein
MAGSKKKKAARRGLNRKQFLLGLVVVCGAALIIECALLIHTFSKKKEKPKENPTPTPTAAVAEQTQPTETPKPAPGEPWGFTMKSYEVTGENRQRIYTVTHDYDENGNEVHCYEWKDETSYLGRLKEEEYFYTYNENGRILSEEKTEMDGNGTVLRSFKTTYRYLEEEPLTVEKNTYDTDGTVVETEELTYDEQGRLLSRAVRSRERWTAEKRRYDDFGNLVERTIQGDYDTDKEMVITYDEEGHKSERIETYLGTVSKEIWFYDEQGRPELIEQYYEGQRIGKFIFSYDGDERICQKRSEYDESGRLKSENRYDKQGRLLARKCYSSEGEVFIDDKFDWEAEDKPAAGLRFAKETMMTGATKWVLAYPYLHPVEAFTPLSCFDISKPELNGPYLSEVGTELFLVYIDSITMVDGDTCITSSALNNQYKFDEQGRLCYEVDTYNINGREKSLIYEYTFY